MEALAAWSLWTATSSNTNSDTRLGTSTKTTVAQGLKHLKWMYTSEGGDALLKSLTLIRLVVSVGDAFSFTFAPSDGLCHDRVRLHHVSNKAWRQAAAAVKRWWRRQESGEQSASDGGGWKGVDILDGCGGVVVYDGWRDSLHFIIIIYHLFVLG